MRSGRIGWLVVAGALAGLCGCAAGGRGMAAEDAAAIVEEMPVDYHVSGKYCGRTEPLRLVVRDRAHMALVPIGDVPVDFDRQMVLFVTTGRVFSESYGIRIDRVWRQGRQIRVGITQIHPSAGETALPQPCSPYYLAVVPKSDLNVEGFVTQIAPPRLENATPRLGSWLQGATSR